MLAYLVARRTREIGIRIALGGTASHIVELVLREAVLMVGSGLVLGLAGTVAVRRLFESQAYGVRPTDPSIIGAVLATLGVVGLAASLLPARRAVNVDPAIVLSES